MNNHHDAVARKEFRQACEMQAEACAALGSPFTSQLCTLMGQRVFSAPKLEHKLSQWPGDMSYRGIRCRCASVAPSTACPVPARRKNRRDLPAAPSAPT